MKLNRSDFIDVIKKTPLVAIDLIVKNKQDEVLLGLRNNAPAKDFWFVPGGRILINEHIADAFQRIALGELGINVSIKDAHFLGIFEHFYQDNFLLEPGVGTHYIVLAYEIKISAPIKKLPKDQHHEYKWLTVEKLLKEDTVHLNTKAFFR